MFLGARASGPHRAEGPQSADRSDTPEPATPPPEAPNAVEAGLGCTAEDWHWRSPRAWASPAWPCGGPVARLRAGRPRSQGWRPSATRRLCAAGPFQTLGEVVDGSVSGTSSWTSAGHVLVARHLLLPRRARIRWRFEHPRQSDESWCSSPRVTSRWLGDRLFERPRPIRVHLHSRAVERHHLHSHPNEVRTLQLRKHSVRHCGLRPAIHPRVDGVPAPEGRRQSTPLALLFGHVQDGIEHREMTEREIAALLGEQVGDVRSKCVCVSSIAWNPLHRLWVRQPIGYCVNTP